MDIGDRVLFHKEWNVNHWGDRAYETAIGGKIVAFDGERGVRIAVTDLIGDKVFLVLREDIRGPA